VDNLFGIKRFIRIVGRTDRLTPPALCTGKEIKKVFPGKLDYLGGSKGESPFKNHSWNGSDKRETPEEAVGNSGQDMQVFTVGQIV
jgi:hypothetical protein